MELRIVPYTVRADGTEVLTFAFAPATDSAKETLDERPEVAIIGVGLHPFGRFPGKSAMDMAADAVRAALADAGVSWPTSRRHSWAARRSPTRTRSWPGWG